MHQHEEPPKSAVLLVNTKSRRGAEWFEKARATLTAEGIVLKRATAFKHPKKLIEAAKQAVAEGEEMVIIGGGDGTFSAVARFFAHKPTVLGVLPLGTGNAFARDLSIPVDVAAACDAILNGKVAHIDMGIVENERFVNVTTVGLSTRIALGLQPGLKKKLGKAVYAVSLIQALVKVQPFHVKLTVDGVLHEFESLQVVIGNGRMHAGPFLIAPDASITGGNLSIYALATTRKFSFLKLALLLHSGRHVELHEVQHFSAKSGRLETEPVRKVTVDGEVNLSTPINFSIAGRALRVAVPLGFEE